MSLALGFYKLTVIATSTGSSGSALSTTQDVTIRLIKASPEEKLMDLFNVPEVPSRLLIYPNPTSGVLRVEGPFLRIIATAIGSTAYSACRLQRVLFVQVRILISAIYQRALTSSSLKTKKASSKEHPSSCLGRRPSMLEAFFASRLSKSMANAV